MLFEESVKRPNFKLDEHLVRNYVTSFCCSPVTSSTQGHLASYIVDDDSKNNSKSQVKIHQP